MLSNRVVTLLAIAAKLATAAKSILVVSAVLVTLALLTSLVGCVPPGEPPPTPGPALGEGAPTGGDRDSDGTQSAISGTVTDLSTGRPGAGIEVSVGDLPAVRTDSEGHYSVPDLPAGEYSVSLELHGRGAPAQGPIFVNVDGQNSVTIDRAYYGQPQPVPTDTPQPAVAAADTPPSTLPNSGAPIGHGPLLIVGLGFLLALVGAIRYWVLDIRY